MKKSIFIFLLGFILAATLTAQRIQVTSPAAGAIWPLNSPQTITWIKSGAMDDRVFIRLYKDMEPAQYISEDTENDGSFPWTVPGSLATGSYTIRVRTLDRAVKGDSSAFTIGRENEESPPPDRPDLKVIWPNGGEEIEYGSSVKIRWQATHLPGAAPIDISLYKGHDELGTLAEALKADRGSFDWPVGKIEPKKLEPGKDYRIRLRVRGTSVSDVSDRPFAIQARSPAGAGGDLELVRLSGERGKLWAHIRCTIPGFSREVVCRITHPEGAPVRVTHVPLVVTYQAKGEKVYKLEDITPCIPDSPDYRSTFKVELDADNRIPESNEMNNVAITPLATHRYLPVIEQVEADFQIALRGQTLRWCTRGLPGGSEGMIRSEFAITVRNYGFQRCGPGELRISQAGYLPEHEGGGAGGTPLVNTVRRRGTIANIFVDDSSREHYGICDLYPFPSPSDLLIEYIWDGTSPYPGPSTFRFPVDFSIILEH